MCEILGVCVNGHGAWKRGHTPERRRQPKARAGGFQAFPFHSVLLVSTGNRLEVRHHRLMGLRSCGLHLIRVRPLVKPQRNGFPLGIGHVRDIANRHRA